jgi:hypothetical protein
LSLTQSLVVTGFGVILAFILAMLARAFIVGRRVDDLVSELQTYVIPHFRPATPAEIREGHREHGDTLPERTAVVEGAAVAQTKRLTDHLDAEMAETKKINGRLARLEKHLNVPQEDS